MKNLEFVVVLVIVGAIVGGFIQIDFTKVGEFTYFAISLFFSQWLNDRRFRPKGSD
jgi:hypothetical protein